jgi:hypothetical protein
MILYKVIQNLNFTNSMRKILMIVVLMFVAVCAYCQPQMMRPNIDLSQYEVVDSLPLEMMSVHFEKEIDIDDDNFINMGSGDYLVRIPKKDKIVIRTNSDRTKGIVVYNSFVFGRHFEFNIKENERRFILWYQDSKTYCGYIYDKSLKVCKYFESKKEFKRFMWRRFGEKH